MIPPYYTFFVKNINLNFHIQIQTYKRTYAGPNFWVQAYNYHNIYLHALYVCICKCMCFVVSVVNKCQTLSMACRWRSCPSKCPYRTYTYACRRHQQQRPTSMGASMNCCLCNICIFHIQTYICLCAKHCIVVSIPSPHSLLHATLKLLSVACK